jgi:hypothetical protein
MPIVRSAIAVDATDIMLFRGLPCARVRVQVYVQYNVYVVVVTVAVCLPADVRPKTCIHN